MQSWGPFPYVNPPFLPNGPTHIKPLVPAPLLRLAGLILAALPLFAGLLTILVDDGRRGVHDMLAGAVVVPAPPEPSA